MLETNKFTRIAAHTDFDTLTVSCLPTSCVFEANPRKFLFQNEVGGLEVEDPNEPGKFVVRTIVRTNLHTNLITNMDV